MTDVKKQVDAARAAVLVVPSPHLATIAVTGGDRLTWLNGLLTCELANRKPGDAVYGLAVGKNGRILADLLVVVDETRALLAVPRDAVATLRASLEHYLVMEDAEMAERVDAFDVYVAHGPRARDVLSAVRSAGAVGGAVDLTGLGGAVMLAPRDRDAAVKQAIERAVVDADGVVGDDEGWEALRLDRGIPRYGADFDAKTYPQEAGLEARAVSFAKGCYLGQEVVCMLEMRGHVKRKIVSLVLDGAVAPARGSKVVDESGAEVGEVTSGGVSPTLGKGVALAMVKRASAEVGTALSAAGVAARVAAPV